MKIRTFVTGRSVTLASSVIGLLAFGCLAYAVSAKRFLQEQKPTERQEAQLSSGAKETSLGFLVRAELRRGTQITFPAPPSAPGNERAAHNGPVAGDKGTLLLKLHFELGHGGCVKLDRDRLLLEDGDEHSYRYGGWWVEDAQYSVCGRPIFARPILGPWQNALWDPITIRPELDSLALVYQVDAKATNLTFGDGKVVILLDKLEKH